MRQKYAIKGLSIIDRLLGIAPDIQSGAKSVLTFGRSQRVYELLMHRNANDGLYNDWYNVGNDIRTAINKFKAETSCLKN